MKTQPTIIVRPSNCQRNPIASLLMIVSGKNNGLVNKHGDKRFVRKRNSANVYVTCVNVIRQFIFNTLRHINKCCRKGIALVFKPATQIGQGMLISTGKLADFMLEIVESKISRCRLIKMLFKRKKNMFRLLHFPKHFHRGRKQKRTFLVLI